MLGRRDTCRKRGFERPVKPPKNALQQTISSNYTFLQQARKQARETLFCPYFFSFPLANRGSLLVEQASFLNKKMNGLYTCPFINKSYLTSSTTITTTGWCHLEYRSFKLIRWKSQYFVRSMTYRHCRNILIFITIIDNGSAISIRIY